MLKRLRWQLTLLYLLAALGLVGVVGGGSYLLLRLYFGRITDLAIQYKMAGLFDQYGLALPPELSAAQQSWRASSGQPARQSLSDDGDGEDHESGEDDHEDSKKSSDDSSQEETYDAQLAPIFVIPVSVGGALLLDTTRAQPPVGPNLDAIAAARANGSDWRTLRLPGGDRARLLTYLAPGPGGLAYLQVGRLLGDQDRVSTQFLFGLLALGSVTILLVGLGSWQLSGRTLGPAQKAWDHQQAFVSNASHELRTPLTFIRATAEIALRSQPQPQVAEPFNDILQECDYMNRLVDDLLLLSRLDTRRLELTWQPIDLPMLLSDVKRQVEKLASAKGVSLALKGASGSVWGDPTRVRQVLLVLLDNALRHTPAGGVIYLESHNLGKRQQIQITDSGSGIPPKDLPHVFERFYQASQDAGEDSRSNGLGLSIAKALVEAQGGTIALQSQVGRGTVATVWLPTA